MCHLAVCWMKTEVVQVLTRCLGHYTTQLFHIARQILHSPDKTMRRTTCTAAVLPNMGCGRPEAHKLYCSHCCCPLWSNFSFFFFLFLFILYVSAHDVFCFASRLYGASFCFCRFVRLSSLAKFTLLDANFLLVNKPGRPLQNRQ